jgi:hypothetical protein
MDNRSVTSPIPFDQLGNADLTVEATYEGGRQGNAADDPLARLLPCGNQGGFRFKGKRSTHDYRLALLYTSGEDRDWPDTFNPETGIFTYFGDNKRPGAGLHETPRGGNELLRFAFARRHGDASQRRLIPPFFVFQKANPSGRDVSFLGLAVPGAGDVDELSDLVAIWRTARNQRFQNYRATFTILDVATVQRAWIEELLAGERLGPSCPPAFRIFSEEGVYMPLEAQRTIEFRSPREQLPPTVDRPLLDAIYSHYADAPHRFEACAIELWRMVAAEPIEVTPTRPSADGGRDGYGRYSIGPPGDRIPIDFSLEAKCYAAEHGAGVRDTARLISRLRHRQFGVFVTTSYVGPQAYRELREDQHPVVVICGRDIVELLKARGIGTAPSVKTWLAQIDSASAS